MDYNRIKNFSCVKPCLSETETRSECAKLDNSGKQICGKCVASPYYNELYFNITQGKVYYCMMLYQSSYGDG